VSLTALWSNCIVLFHVAYVVISLCVGLSIEIAKTTSSAAPDAYIPRESMATAAGRLIINDVSFVVVTMCLTDRKDSQPRKPAFEMGFLVFAFGTSSLVSK